MSEVVSSTSAGEQVVVVKATTLADVLKQQGPLPEPELVTTFVQVLEDLELAHSQAMLHRDISTARIVLDGDKWKLTDYGVAKLGTVRYMSPERCQGKPVDARSDTYSLGVALFEAATGRLPFDAEMKFKVIEAHISKPPPPPRSIRPSLSHAVEQVILRALSKNPASRFQTAAEFKRALENVPHASRTPVSDAGRAAAPRPVAARVRAGEPRRVKPAAVLVPLVMVALAAGVYFLLKGGILGKKVPSVVGMAREAAEQALRRQGLDVETDTKDDTAAAGTVVAQVPLPGEQASGGRLVRISVSTGMVAVPVLAGLTVDEARARLTELALRAVRIESAYSDGHATGIVVSSAAKPGSRLSPHSSVNLTVSAGRATCPQCGARREPGAKFCTKCGYKF